MFQRADVEKALELSDKGHELMKWLGEQNKASGPAFDRMHQTMSLPEAARGWVERNYTTIPARFRPERDDLAAFANLVGTYLETSFEFAPDRRRAEGDCGCFCPWCTVWRDLGSLKTRTLTRADKDDADRLVRRYVRVRADALGQPLVDDEIARIAADEALREPLALATWTAELLRRLDGTTSGPAVLALWRRFAWKPTGSPKPDFALTADAVIDAAARVDEAIRVVA